MSLNYDTPAGKLVYDADPATEYTGPRRLGHSALRVQDGRIEIFDPHPEPRSTTAADVPPEFSTFTAPFATPCNDHPELTDHRGPELSATGGFGNVAPRRMLETGPPAKHPWLTVPLAEQELAIGEYKADRSRIFLDSVK